jgi:hypothetical protein
MPLSGEKQGVLMKNEQQYEFNRSALLPPVGCPLVIKVAGHVLRAERTIHMADKSGQMEYVLKAGQLITGRFEWSYP